MSALPMTLNTTAETETAKIARGLRERDMELFADLVGRCQHRLVRYLLYLTGRREYAEDLAQETWIRVLQRGSQYNGRQRFDPWLFAIARCTGCPVAARSEEHTSELQAQSNLVWRLLLEKKKINSA